MSVKLRCKTLILGCGFLSVLFLFSSNLRADSPPFLDQFTSDVTISIDKPLQIELSGIDPEGSPLTFSIEGSPSPLSYGATLSPTSDTSALFSWTPLDSVIPRFNVFVVVRDASGNLDHALLTINVRPSSTAERISTPIIVGPLSGLTNASQTFRALSKSSHGNPLEYQFSICCQGENSILFEWQTSDSIVIPADHFGLPGNSLVSAIARSQLNSSVMSLLPGSLYFTAAEPDTFLNSQFPLQLNLSGRAKVLLTWFSNPLNAGLIHSYDVQVETLIPSGDPDFTVTLSVENPNEEPLFHQVELNYAAHESLRNLLNNNPYEDLLLTINAKNSQNNLIGTFKIERINQNIYFPYFENITTSNITSTSADLNLKLITPPGNFYDVSSIRLYEENILAYEFPMQETITLNGLSQNQLFDFSVRAVDSVQTPAFEGNDYHLSFRTNIGGDATPWIKLNQDAQGNSQPLDAGITGIDYYDYSFASSAKNAQGDLLYFFVSPTLGSLAGKFTSGGANPTKTWQLYSNGTWDNRPDLIPTSFSNALANYDKVKLFPIPGSNEAVSGFASFGFYGLLNGRIAMDIHGATTSIRFEPSSESDGRWQQWESGALYKPYNLNSLMSSWNQSRGDFDLNESSGIGMSIITYGQAIGNSFPQRLTAVRYDANNSTRTWSHWNNSLSEGNGNWDSPTDWNQAFILKPSAANPWDESFNFPTVAQLSSNNFITLFSYTNNAQNRTVLTAARYEDGTLPTWSWWNGTAWESDGNHQYEAIDAIESNYTDPLAKMVHVTDGIVAGFYIKNGRLYYIFYNENDGTLWSSPREIDVVKSYSVTVDSDKTIWLYYSPDDRQIFLMKKPMGSDWLPADRIYNSSSSLVRVLNTNFVATDMPICFIREETSMQSHIYAIAHYNEISYWSGETPLILNAPPPHQSLDPSKLNRAETVANSSPGIQYGPASAGPLTIDQSGFLYAPRPAFCNATIRNIENINAAVFWGGFWDVLLFPSSTASDSTRQRVYVGNRMITGGGGAVRDFTGTLVIYDMNMRETNNGHFCYFDCPSYGEFSPDLNVNTTYSPQIISGFGWISDIAVDELQGLLFVTNSNKNEIIVYDTENLVNNLPSRMATYTNEGTAPGQFRFPQGIDLDSDGYLYLTDRDNHRIQKFSFDRNTLTFSLIQSWGQLGREEGNFIYPFGIAADPTFRLIYVTDPYNQRVQIFDRDGNFIYSWNTDDTFLLPHGIAADGLGNIFVSESVNLVKYNFIDVDSDGDLDENANGIPDSLENSAPTASNVLLTPTPPLDSDDLNAFYLYSDPENDSESGTEIRWFKNGVATSPDHDNALLILADDTTPGDEWHFTVRPKDGNNFGAVAESNRATIAQSSQFTIYLQTNGGGSIQLTPPGGVYSVGTTVTIKAVPDSGYQFYGWTNDIQNNISEQTLVVDSDKIIAGIFIATPECNDGIDNDADGLVDMSDLGCQNPADNKEEASSICLPTCQESGFNPVCGADEKTYINDCLAQCAGETDWTLGVCPTTVQSTLNIHYKDPIGSIQLLDVHTGNHLLNAPVVMTFHGGGGQKSTMDVYRDFFTNLGFVVVNVQYRIDDIVFPSNMQDVACAIAWVKRFISDDPLDPTTNFHGDPSRVVLLGHSGGGNATSFVAYNKERADLLDGCPQIEDISVIAEIGSAPHTDLDFVPSGRFQDALGPQLGSLYNPLDHNQWAPAEPINFVDSNDPPGLFITGDNDSHTNIVGPDGKYAINSVLMSNKLEDYGICNQLHIEPGYRHNDPKSNFQTNSAIQESVVEFLISVFATNSCQGSSLIAPSDLTVTEVTLDSISLSWTDNSSNEEGFKIERKIFPSETFEELAVVISSDVNFFTDFELPSNTQVIYKIKAFRGNSFSDYSNEVTVTTASDSRCDDGIQNGDELGIDCGGSCLNACECFNNSDCLDNTVCNGLELCQSNTCIPGIPLTCDDGDACNGVESCDSTNGCQAGAALTCDDGDACNGVESCDSANGCQAGTPLICSEDALCDPILGCQEPPDLVSSGSDADSESDHNSGDENSSDNDSSNSQDNTSNSSNNSQGLFYGGGGFILLANTSGTSENSDSSASFLLQNLVVPDTSAAIQNVLPSAEFFGEDLKPESDVSNIEENQLQRSNKKSETTILSAATRSQKTISSGNAMKEPTIPNAPTQEDFFMIGSQKIKQIGPIHIYKLAAMKNSNDIPVKQWVIEGNSFLKSKCHLVTGSGHVVRFATPWDKAKKQVLLVKAILSKNEKIEQYVEIS